MLTNRDFMPSEGQISLDSSGVCLGLSLFEKASVFLLVLTLSILGAARKITSRASSAGVSTSIIWVCVMVNLVGWNNPSK